MAAPIKTNWSFNLAFAFGLCWIAYACNSTPQGISDYQRAQLRLQHQQQELQAANSIRNSVNRVMETTAQMYTATPEYGVDTNRTQCVTGQDYLGRIVTECGHP